MALAEVTIPEWTFGERLAKARKHARLNQAEMAERIHVSPSAIAKWESDRGEPRNFRDTIDAWSEVTGVDPAWLLGFRTGSFSPLVGLPATLTPELPFPPPTRQLAVVGGQ